MQLCGNILAVIYFTAVVFLPASIRTGMGWDRDRDRNKDKDRDRDRGNGIGIYFCDFSRARDMQLALDQLLLTLAD